LDTGKLLQLARTAISSFRDKVNVGELKPQIRVLVKHKVTEFKIRDKGGRLSASLEPYEKLDWSIAIHDFIEKHVKSWSLFKDLTDAIVTEYKNELTAKGYHLPTQVEFWLSNFVFIILYEELEGKLTEERLLDIIATFKSELNSAPLEYHITAFLNGVNLKVESIALDSGVLLRKPKPMDFEYQHELLSPMWRESSPISNAILELKMRAANDLQVREKIEQVITLLRLFRLGAVYSNRQIESRKTVMWPGGTVERSSGRIFGSTYTYTIDETSEILLKKFVERFEALIPLKVTDKRLASLHVALSRYNNALLEPVETERKLMTAVMGLEALYVLRSERGETSFRLSLRVAKLLGLLGCDPLEVRKVIEESYTIRSKVGHGSIVSNKARTKVNELLNKVLEYLRKSIIFFTLGSKIMGKGDWVTLINKSMIDVDSFEQLKNKVEACLRDFPREVIS